MTVIHEPTGLALMDLMAGGNGIYIYDTRNERYTRPVGLWEITSGDLWLWRLCAEIDGDEGKGAA